MHIGTIIRKYRKARNLTLKEMSERTKLTKSLLSQIENNKANPSISSLMAIANALNTTVGSFFEIEKDSVVKKNKRKAIHTKSGVTLYLLTPDVAHRKVEFLYCEYKKGASTEIMYTHEGEEYGFVLKGRIKVTVEDTEYIVEEGDSITIDSTKPHMTSNIYDGMSITIWVNTPPSF